ncbi:hypothetical protein A2733_01975 [Candidatus Nomurabacteria bacterium RIFCSPHIGHO2_01_FULL_40_20]|nr:MAG: hypothetical protein A2733_01975 [Candidatus Nomurabacteria bacterium RIFCSPHIGHO2_01_FULL_40_20]
MYNSTIDWPLILRLMIVLNSGVSFGYVTAWMILTHKKIVRRVTRLDNLNPKYHYISLKHVYGMIRMQGVMRILSIVLFLMFYVSALWIFELSIASLGFFLLLVGMLFWTHWIIHTFFAYKELKRHTTAQSLFNPLSGAVNVSLRSAMARRDFLFYK